MKKLTLILLVVFSSCGKPCRGIYTERDAYGTLKRFNEYAGPDGQCMTDTLALTRWQSSLEDRTKKGVTCTPQQFSATLISNNNFYSYRDGKVLLDLDPSGTYRKLTLTVNKSGQPVFTRLEGCFYERSGQLLLDTEDVASSQYFDPMEIFSYTATSTTVDMVRFDDSQGWDYRYCPYLDTPWGFCDLLRNGNEMYFPNLTPAQEASTLNEALLIRKQFNYDIIDKGTFNSVWDQVENTGAEVTREEYKYAISTIVDTPRYIDEAWSDYVKGNRPIMPDLTSSTMPPVCYPSRQSVTLSNGNKGFIQGEACYVDGQYTFVQNQN